MDSKDIMACNCVAPVDTSSLWAYLVITNNSLFTGQIVNSMANVKQKKLNRKNLRQKVIANPYYKNPITNIGNFYYSWDSQVVLVVKNPATNTGRCKRHEFDPWVGRIAWRRAWQPTPVFLPGESHKQRSLAGCIPKGHTQLDIEKAMATHSSTLAWKIPLMEEPGRLQSMGLLRVGRNWVASLSLFTFMHWRRKWQLTPVFLPGESQGRGSMVGCCLWRCTESDMTKAT